MTRITTIQYRLLALALVCTLGCESDQSSPLPTPVPKDAAERFAHTMCAAEFECGCGLHAAVAECEAEITARFDAIIESGVSVDQACFDDFLAGPLFSDCAAHPNGAWACVALTGSAKLGEPCGPWNMFTMFPGAGCRVGLRCSVTGYCEDPHDPIPLYTEPCNPDVYSSCGYHLFCDRETRTCVDRTPIGGACRAVPECEPGSYCDGLGPNAAGVCTPRVGIGEPCTTPELRPCVDYGWCDSSSKTCESPAPLICANQDLGVWTP